MINRRSTPSGDGRGRGRTGGSGRDGRPAFRSGDARDGRGGFRGDEGGRRGGYRDNGSRDDSRGNDYRGNDSRGNDYRGNDYRGGDSRGERAGSREGGFRGGAGRGDSRRDDSRRDDFRPRTGDGRDALRAGRGGSRFGGGDGDRRDARDDRFSRGDRGGFSSGDRGGRPERGYRDNSYTRDDRGGRPGRGDERPYARDDRGGRPGRGDDRYARDSRPGRGDERPYTRDDRGGRPGRGDDRYARDSRPSRGDDRFSRDDRRFGGGRDERPNRDDRYGRDSRTDRYAGGDRSERGRGDERTGFKAGRGGRRDDAAPATTRARYGRRDGDGRPARTPRRDDVQTLGGNRRQSPERPAVSSPQHARVKAARQPIRDRDLFPEGYTDERDTTEVPNGVRLQKVLAQAGVASRRACEEMIGEGRVTVDGQVVRRFGAKVDPAKQIIHVDGKRIPTAPDLVYYALNKPIGVVSTMEDPQGRPCLADYVQELAPRLFHVGRLDTETEGLLLLTNDGELANRLTHPSYGVQKKYWAKVPGPIPRDLGRRLKQGIELEDGLARADSFAIVQEHGQQALVEVVLHEGRKHVVRRMLEEAGHRVIDLARIEFGPVKLGRTKPGTIRSLSLKEVGDLYAAVKL
ncbi:pseudouridine synthase [Nonomuraea maritima]|uniref:pseudouridine synthase n=1 Tax=Nonomuraea maritima TaxID=683260 RepID=UPI0037249D16